jgi:hypothetical protein
LDYPHVETFNIVNFRTIFEVSNFNRFTLICFSRLAGLPGPIIERALKVAGEFEEEQNNLLELAQIIKAH